MKSVVVLTLFLVATSSLESVGVAAGAIHVGNESAAEDAMQAEWVYGFQQGYTTVGTWTFMAMFLITLASMRASFTALQQHKSCRTGTHDPAFKGRQLDSWHEYPLDIASYTPVLVSRGPDNETVPWVAVPYMAQTRNESGFIALLVHEAKDWRGKDLFQTKGSVKNMPLIIGVECSEFDERDPDSVAWLDMGFESWMQSSLVNPDTIRGVPIKDNLIDDSEHNQQLNIKVMYPTKEFKWCPSQSMDRIEVTSKDIDCPSWGESGKSRDFLHRLEKKRLHLNDDEVDPTTEGRGFWKLAPRPDFYAHLWKYVSYVIFGLWCYACTFGTLRHMSQREELHRSLTSEYLGLAYRRDLTKDNFKRQEPVATYNATAVNGNPLFLNELNFMRVKDYLGGRKIGFPMMSSIIGLGLLVFLFGVEATLFYSDRVRHWYASQKFVMEYDRVQIYINTFRNVIVVMFCMVAPLTQWIFFKSDSWAIAESLVRARVTATWLNYFLALLYFAHAMNKYTSGVLHTPLTMMLDDATADLLLGTLAAATGMVDLAELARDAHGWGTACTFAELGYTFRTIARETPELFPEGSKQELFCTESIMTFEQVLNTTTDTVFNDLEDSVMHNGNTCILECSLSGNYTTSGEKETISYPIACAIEGLAASRWTLSAERDRQRYRLCPMPKGAAVQQEYQPFAPDRSQLINEAAPGLYSGIENVVNTMVGGSN